MVGDTSSRTEELNNLLGEALKTREFAGLSRVFADNASVLPPRRAALSGRDNIESYWAQATRIKELKFDTVSVDSLGYDVARELGTLVMRVGSGGKGAEAEAEGAADEAKVLTGSYIFLWKRAGTEWSLDTAIWNTRPQQDDGQVRTERREARREQRRAERRAGRREQRRAERQEQRQDQEEAS